MTLWVYDEKFLIGMQFLFKTLQFTMGEDDNPEHLTQEQEDQRTTMNNFEFPRGLRNSRSTLKVAVRAWGSPLGHHPKMDLSTDSNSGST
jgi:hypothetical protein